jgi:phosphoglycerol transferase MdoB-like AlkP superfamily enzyme
MLVLILCGFFGFLGLLLYWNSGTILRDDSFLLGYFAPLVWLIAVVGPIVIALPRTRARFAWLTRHHADLWLILGLAVVSAYLFFQALGVRVTTIPLF